MPFAAHNNTASTCLVKKTKVGVADILNTPTSFEMEFKEQFPAKDEAENKSITVSWIFESATFLRRRAFGGNLFVLLIQRNMLMVLLQFLLQLFDEFTGVLQRLLESIFVQSLQDISTKNKYRED